METPYDRIAEEWHATPRTSAALPYLEAWMTFLPEGAIILDAGAGPGGLSHDNY